jgi:hypothetical protein
MSGRLASTQGVTISMAALSMMSTLSIDTVLEIMLFWIEK